MRFRQTLLLATIAVFLASALLASSPAFWELSSYQEFIKGKFDHVALSRDGALTVAPALDTVFSSGQAYLWSLARSADGTIYAGTGNHGRLYQIEKNGKGQVIWTAPQPEIFAVAVSPAGVVYAGTSPNGKIYRIENGRASEYFDPKSAYIWSLVIGKDGALYAGTGTEGKIFRISAAGQGREFFETGQTNVTGIALARDGSLLAGTEPNGVLYRVTGQDKAFALFDSNLPEIRAMAQGLDGGIFAAGLGGSVAKKAQSAIQAPGGSGVEVPTMTTSITVTANAATGEIKPAEPPKPPPAAAPVTATASTTATTVVDVTGVERSAIYQIHPDNTVETIWSSKEENVYDILPTPGGILFVTDLGHLYRMDANRRFTLVVQTGEGDLNRLFADASGILVAAGTGGKISRLGTSPNHGGGIYESPIFDAGSVARWGHIRHTGAGHVKLWTRSGNSARPDRTWSDWVAPSSTDLAVTSPNSRYLNWKVELNSESTVEGLTIGYLPQNNPPIVRSITALTTVQPAAASTKAANGSNAATSSYSITVTDTGDAGPSTSTGTPTQTLSRAGSQQLLLSWQAEDPDGDKLVYAIAFRGEGEQEWKSLRQNLHENTLSLEADSLADGRYLFEVKVSDRESNAGASARDAELVSSPVLIDNTPPKIVVGPVRNRTFDWQAIDATSPLRRAEYSVDGGTWVPVDPVSGILDEKQASFHVDLSALTKGEHAVVIRALDQANNSGQAKIVLP